ncbi:MAG: hypothetical protein K0R36_568 [Chryseobacterium sp.]|jgi:hypothetical protein|nr:hypothetical protein [Chryseobacterium sp.]
MQKKETPKTPIKKPTTPKKAVAKTVKVPTKQTAVKAEVSAEVEKHVTPKRTPRSTAVKVKVAPVVKNPPVKTTTRKTPVKRIPAKAKVVVKAPVKKPTSSAIKPAAKKVLNVPVKPATKPDDKRIGNNFWMNRAKHGREKLFATPKLLWDAASEYFNYIKENPLYETKVFQFQGTIVTKEVPIMRAMTMRELCFYLNCNETYFRQFKANLADDEKDFSSVIEDIETIVYTQKFQGAAGNLLNANIIARDLGLTDKKDVSSNGETISFATFLMQSSDDEETK